MSKRNMSERMCIGLMLCEAAPCDLNVPHKCAPPPKGKALNRSLAEFTGLVGPQSPQLLNLLRRIGAHARNNKDNLPELFDDEKKLLIELMETISAKGEEEQKEIFQAMQKAFGITGRQIDKMLALESNNQRRGPSPEVKDIGTIARAYSLMTNEIIRG